MERIVNNKNSINADYAKKLTESVNIIDDLYSSFNPQWRVILNNIRRGNNYAHMSISTQYDLDFLDELKDLGFKVRTEDTRFYKEAIISWK